MEEKADAQVRECVRVYRVQVSYTPPSPCGYVHREGSVVVVVEFRVTVL